jgi:hypothetical protein
MADYMDAMDKAIADMEITTKYTDEDVKGILNRINPGGQRVTRTANAKLKKKSGYIINNIKSAIPVFLNTPEKIQARTKQKSLIQAEKEKVYKRLKLARLPLKANNSLQMTINPLVSGLSTPPAGTPPASKPQSSNSDKKHVQGLGFAARGATRLGQSVRSRASPPSTPLPTSKTKTSGGGRRRFTARKPLARRRRRTTRRAH